MSEAKRSVLVRAERADRLAEWQQRSASRLAASQRQEGRQRRPARAEAEQRQADRHEGEVVELRHGEDARERDLEDQHGGGGTGDPEDDQFRHGELAF